MQRRTWTTWARLVGLTGAGLLLTQCHPPVIGPTAPSGYRLILPEASQTLRAHPLPLTVGVRDATGQPVEDVVVEFRLPEDWATRAQVDPPVVNTRQGRATTTFRARAAGQVLLHVTVEDRTVAIPIAVVGDAPRF